jgi:hypothetical protein
MREEEKEEPQQTLLKELCGADEPLYGLLSWYLYQTPLAAISKKSLDALVEEAEGSGDFRQAFDKAIFEGAQKPGERERYVEVIRRLASKAIHAAEQASEEREKKGLTERAASLRRRIEDYRLMSERAGDVLAVASSFYSEKLVESEEAVKREARHEKRKRFEREDKAIGEREKRERTARRRERRKMSRGERREARKREKTEDAAAQDRREAREERRSEAEREEQRIAKLEKTARDARRDERKGT